MMWNDGGGGWWLLALPMMIICVVMMARMMSHGHGSHGAHASESNAHRPGGAEGILAERLARGQIDTEEYESRLAALRATKDQGRA